MRVVLGPTYSIRDKNTIKDQMYGSGYYADVTWDEQEAGLDKTATIMRLLGHRQWCLALLLYEESVDEMYYYPFVKLYRVNGQIVGTDPADSGLWKYNHVLSHEAESRNPELMERVREDLQALDSSPEFAVVVSFVFPVNPSRRVGLWTYPNGRLVSTKGTGGLILRAMVDLADYFRQSSDPELSGAAVLAEMV